MGGIPPTTVARGSKGGETPKIFFLKKCLVKYCNFIVNLDCLLCHIFDGRSYVNHRVFFPRRKPSIIYEGIVFQLCINLRMETMRV